MKIFSQLLGFRQKNAVASLDREKKSSNQTQRFAYGTQVRPPLLLRNPRMLDDEKLGLMLLDEYNTFSFLGVIKI